MMIDENENIISSICPSQYCCPNKNGCVYDEIGYGLCVEGRDPKSFVYGTCIDGYSESLHGTKCVDCNGDSYFVYLLLPITFALCITIILIATNTEKSTETSVERNFQTKYYVF